MKGGSPNLSRRLHGTVTKMWPYPGGAQSKEKASCSAAGKTLLKETTSAKEKEKVDRIQKKAT